MKKMKALCLVMVIIFAFCPFVMPISVNAVVPKQLSISYTETAPIIDGTVDASYGKMKWNQNATDFQIGDYNLYPRTNEEWNIPELQADRSVMNMKGWLAFDKEAIYMAFETTDLEARAADDSAKYWNSTNVQVVMYLDSYRYFFTLHYGSDKTAMLTDDKTRSELDVTKVTEYVLKETKEGNQTKICWEIKIPYDALKDFMHVNKYTDMRLGVVQTSMAYGYYSCQAFGEAYNLKYNSLLPVKIEYDLPGDFQPANPDIDCDGNLTISDAMIMLNNFESAYVDNAVHYDIDGDGIVDLADIECLLLLLLEFEM